jgi:hypothetical protein
MNRMAPDGFSLSTSIAAAPRAAPENAPSAPRARLALAPGSLSGAVMLAGITVAAVGGAWRPGALSLLPCLDGALVSGVVAALLLLLHGYRERLVLAAVAPITAVTAVGFFQLHSRPLAPLGLEIALIGLAALIAERARSAAGTNLDETASS